MKAAKKSKPIIAEKPLKLDIGCGNNPKEGFTGIDISPNCKADIVHDVNQYPWPFEDNSVEEIHCSHFVEHLDGMQRIDFFNECYRIMKAPYTDAEGREIKSTMTVITPAPFTHRYMQDPTHKFPMVVQEFYNYLHKESRDGMGLSHYPINCDFMWEGLFVEDNAVLGGRTVEYRHYEARHSINTLIDLQVKLTKR